LVTAKRFARLNYDKKVVQLYKINLGNSKVRAFITHCGYNSLTESTYAGVPLIVMPLFGDQFGNAKLIEKRQIGVVLDKTNLTEDAITEALTAVLFDKQ